MARASGFEFVDDVVGGVVPSKYIPAVEKGVREAMEEGIVAGYKVVDLRVSIHDPAVDDPGPGHVRGGVLPL
jgi:elongation factor G